MAHLTTYSCRNCGGVLIKDQLQEVLECPFCGNAYDLVRMHSDEYSSRAQVNMQQMEFHAAKEKYETVLSKDPQNFEALLGLVLCSGKVQSENELRTPEKMKDRALDEMMAEAKDAQEKAAPEHAEYFSVLHQLTELAKKHQLTDKRIDSLSEASSDKFQRFAAQDVVRASYYSLICVLILAALATGGSSHASRAEARFIIKVILILVGVLVVSFIVDNLFLKPFLKRDNHQELSKLHNAKDTSVTNQKALEKEYAELYQKLQSLRPEKKDASAAPAYNSSYAKDVFSEVSEGDLSCSQCGGKLSGDKANKAYRCMSCGVAFGNTILFDEHAVENAKKSILDGEFNEADLWCRCALATQPHNFYALQRRVLCAGKWKLMSDLVAQKTLTSIRKKSVLARLSEAQEHAATSYDQEYFKKCEEMIDLHERYWAKTREYSKDQAAIDSLKAQLEAKGREIYDIDSMREQSARLGVIQ